MPINADKRYADKAGKRNERQDCFRNRIFTENKNSDQNDVIIDKSK